MPRLSDSMEEGTILTWSVAVGDVVAIGQEIAEIETDKATMAYESDVAGKVLQIVVGEGGTAAVGAVIALIGELDAQLTPSAGSESADEFDEDRPLDAAAVSLAAPLLPAFTEASSGAHASAARPTAGTADAAPAGGGARIKASPVARRMAREKGIDLSGIAGSGPGGRITKSDVERAEPSSTDVLPRSRPAEAPSPASMAKGQVRLQELTRAQRVVALRMAESKATVPHFYLTLEIDMTRAVEARAAIKAASAQGSIVPSFNDMVVKACALALVECPMANGAYKGEHFELYERVNVGVAVASEGGLVVPTIFDADKKGLRQIASDTRAMAARVREGTITPPELSGGTFTVSNLGMFGIEEFGAVVNRPQAAILAVGAIREAPAVRNAGIVAAQLMKVTLSCDHRILYGADGAAFLALIRRLLEQPMSLAL